jgi:cytochrome P450
MRSPDTPRPAATAGMRLVPPALALPDEADIRWVSIPDVIRHPEQHWPRQIWGRPLFAGRIGGRTLALIADPAAAKTVLGGSHEQFPKWHIFQRRVAGGLGRQDLSASTGEASRRLRRIFASMFQPEMVSALVHQARHATLRAAHSWGASGRATKIDAYLEMNKLALEMIWKALFGTGPGSYPIPQQAARSASVHQLRGILKVALADQSAILQRMDATDDVSAPAGTAALPSERAMREEVVNNARAFMIVGQETTALTLTWVLWLLAHDLESQQRAREQIDQVVGSSDVEDAHLPSLTWTRHLINEAMRLYPPAFVLARVSPEPVVLSGERLPADTVLAVCIYVLHRHPDWWEEPDCFRPARFAAGEPRHASSFLPFGMGRHACIGAAFAEREILAVLATILQRYHLRPAAPPTVRLRTGTTLCPQGSVPVVLQPRG